MMPGCPETPLSCLSPENIFAGVYKANCGGFADPSNYQAERALFNNYFGEMINNYGVTIGYQVNTFNVEEMNPIYGEHTLMYWLNPVEIKAYIQMENVSPIYGIAGMDSADTLTLYLHIKDFESKFSLLSVFNRILYTEGGKQLLTESGSPILVDTIDGIYTPFPKAQDKIIVYPFGCDRPNDRSAKIFEVTEALDEDASELNPVMGHYVWRLKAVRSEHNFGTNDPREAYNKQISDNSYFGKLSSALFPELSSVLSDNKVYRQNSDEIVKRDVFPPSTGGSDGSVYGNYF